MIDIHSHLLPEIDDGASGIEEALALCDIGRRNHIHSTVLTPHFNALGDVNNFLEIRNQRYNQLKTGLERVGNDIQLFCGAEVFVDDDIFFVSNLGRLAINNSRYLLIEFDFYSNKLRDIHAYLNEIYSMGLVPIIAHPERYEYFQRNYDAVSELASRGILFQINAGSLASRDGREEFELAYEMAYKGAAAFIGTDAHSPGYRANDMEEMLRLFPQDIDRRLMHRMLEYNAQCVLNNEDIPPRPYSRLEKRRRY